ncbi:hypothetical protein BJ170DRAFT_288194 [Xylariales sp. AK1849]|nr:hypothetical protein BJ170DRAFT_288194 [Xylariales sp. AK1849]
MGLIIAPFNNAMRIGQGFNSYTQQICIDDAVVKDANRAPNLVTNDEWTMKQIAESMQSSADELKIEGLTQDTLSAEYQTALDEYYSRQPAGSQPMKASGVSIGKTAEAILETEDPVDSSLSAEEQQNIKTARAAAKKEGDQAVHEAQGKAAAQNAATIDLTENTGTKRTAASLTDLKPVKRYAFVSSGRRGPSQIVTYTSRFISKVSDITDDMNISGGLSIKYNMIGGSGAGSFLDAEKLMNSDLNFYISVKVVNQTINAVDSLRYIPLGHGVEDGNAFLEIFGDSFISGFIEGGEFNAVVSMKILNKEKKTNIAASAKVALTIGPSSIEAEGKVGIAKENLDANTETTYQVGWSGGGHLKNSNAPWTMDSLLEVAARFPDLVATTPQRTYAILTKYEALRSFQESKPPKFSPLMYENATLYTNAMLDSYMEYKALYRMLYDEIFEIEGGTRTFAPNQAPAPPSVRTIEAASTSRSGSLVSISTDTNPDDTTLTTEESKKIHDITPFDPSIQGLDLARRAIRGQMSRIVMEVDRLTKSPDIAVKEVDVERFQSPTTFKTRLPITRLAKKTPSAPLAIGKISVETLDGEDIPPPIYEGTLDENSKILYGRIVAIMPAGGRCLRMGDLFGPVPVAGPPTAAAQTPAAFNDLMFVRPEFLIQRIDVQVTKGSLSGLTILYDNGLTVSHGSIQLNLPGIQTMILALHRQEKIISCSMETGKKVTGTADKDAWDSGRIIGLQLFTNRGQSLIAQPVAAVDSKGNSAGDGVKYKDIAKGDFDPTIQNGHLVALWGYSTMPSSSNEPGFVSCLGLTWGNQYEYTGPPIDTQAKDSTLSAPDQSQKKPGQAPFNHPAILSLKAGWSLAQISNSASMQLNNATAFATESRRLDTVEMFWIATDGSVQITYFYEGQSWGRGEIAPAGSAAQCGITATSCDPKRQEVWWIGPSGSVEGCVWNDGSAWTRYQLKGSGSASITAGIASVSRKNLTQEVWWITPDGAVDGAAWYSGQSWYHYNIARYGSAHPKGSIKALSRKDNTMEIWYTGLGHSIEGSSWYEGFSWQNYTLARADAIAEDGRITGVSRELNTMELFWVAPNGAVVGSYWCDNGKGWKSCEYTPAGAAKATSGIQATTVRPERMDVIFIAPDDSVQAMFSAGGSWKPYAVSDAGVAAAGSPVAVYSRRKNLMELWFKPTDGNMIVGSTIVT